VIDFDSQVAVVTGAGRGLGRLYALDLARRGASVVVNDVGTSMHGDGADSGVADEVVAEITAAGGVAIASYDSVATPEGGAAIVATAVERFGRLDAVVSNAGIFSTIAFDELSVEDWRRMLTVHVDGAFYLSQPAYRVMKEQGYGRFVFIASSAGMFGQPMSAHYAAAKSGIVGLTNVIAIEGAPHGILANTVLPFGHSRMVTETMGDAAAMVGDRDKDNKQESFLTAIQPEYVVPIVTYLASRDCTVTHQNYSACARRFARVFVGLGEGWVAEPGSAPSAEDVAANFDELSATEPFIVPGSIFDEVFAVCERLGIAPA
jgi:NAD(P)-dependent dehydrogenase (short-subunit alcohol dehydrogenase family)